MSSLSRAEQRGQVIGCYVSGTPFASADLDSQMSQEPTPGVGDPRFKTSTSSCNGSLLCVSDKRKEPSIAQRTVVSSICAAPYDKRPETKVARALEIKCHLATCFIYRPRFTAGNSAIKLLVGVSS